MNRGLSEVETKKVVLQLYSVTKQLSEVETRNIVKCGKKRTNAKLKMHHDDWKPNKFHQINNPRFNLFKLFEKGKHDVKAVQ